MWPSWSDGMISDEEYFYFPDDYESDDLSEYGGGIIMAEDDYYSETESELEEKLRRLKSQLQGKKRFYGEANECDQGDQVKPEMPSLVDICSRFIALNFPFAYIEGRYPPVPEELQIKIISFSFPEDEAVVEKYAKFSRKCVDFDYPRELCSKGAVTNMHQIGFRLSATVEDKRQHRSVNEGKCYVTIQFDRGKITSVHCSCDSSINWCAHVIAAVFQRINNKDEANIQLRIPISDSLNTLRHEQLLKLTQYLLWQHQNEPVMDTAQSLLDRLLHPGTRIESSGAQLEDINEVHGAPDPTAGPGFEDESHWFVCQEGFKLRCNSINYESVTDLGFMKLGELDNIYQRNCDSIHELWISSRGNKSALVKGNVQNELESDSYYGYTSYRREKELLEVLEMIEDLLHCDPITAVKLLSSCTEQVVTKLMNNVSNRLKDEGVYGRSDKMTNTNATPTTSQAMGFTPRPFSCWTFINEIARLWRLSILNPSLPPKYRQEVLENLSNWSSQVTRGCFVAELVPWLGLEVACRLGQLEWNQLNVEALNQGKLLFQPRICSYTVVRFSNKNSVKRQGKNSVSNIARSHSKGKLPKDIASCSGSVASFNLPSHICFGNQVMEIHTCCSIVDALYLHRDKTSAVRLSLWVAMSLITHFKGEITTDEGLLDLPVDNEIDLDKTEETRNVCKHETCESDSLSETVSSASSVGHCCRVAEVRREIWPQGTVLSVTSFVFLYQMMLKNPGIMKACFAEAKSNGPTVELELKSIHSADSLMFQLGVFALIVPRFPSVSPSVEVEQFDYENWLTDQLVNAKPAEHDLELLSQVASFICKHNRWSFWLPSSLARVLFCHLFKDASCSLDGELKPRNELALKVVFYTLESSKTFQATSTGWAMFFYAMYRHWASLVELVLESLVGFPKYLEQAIEYILDVSLGNKGDKSSDPLNSDDSSQVSRETEVWLDESVTEIQARVAFSLAKVLRNKPSRETKASNEKNPNKCAEADNPLSICAIKLGARSALLSKHSPRACGRVVRWLIEFAVRCGHNGINCLMSCEGSVTEFLKQGDVLDLCERIMNKDESFHGYVKSMLLTQVDLAIRKSSSHQIKEVFTFCRVKPSVAKSNVLPWLCQEVQKQTHQREVPFDVLLEASQSLFEFFKDKVKQGDTNFFGKEKESSRDNNLQYSLARLFGEDSVEEEEFVSDPLPANPYSTPYAHPHLEMAFELGLLAVECAAMQSRGETVGYDRRYGVKQRLCDFSRIVCYVTKKSWLKSNADLPSESGDAEDPSKEETPQISSYLERFVLCLINTVENPCWLLAVLEEMADDLEPKAANRYRLRRSAEPNENNIVTACTKYNVLQLLLEKCLDAFTKLLTGPKVEKMLENLGSQRHRYDEQLKWELNSKKLYDDTKFSDVLRCAKKAFSLLDDSNKTFENLLQEMEARHSELKSLLDDIRRNDGERDTDRNPVISLLPYIAHRLIPELALEHFEDQLFW